jgi:hypothetical protein
LNLAIPVPEKGEHAGAPPVVLLVQALIEVPASDVTVVDVQPNVESKLAEATT